jgi:hypothetical protein
MTANTSNHHRYGEVKTRLTIGAAGQFAWYYHIYTRYYPEESDGNNSYSQGPGNNPKATP